MFSKLFLFTITLLVVYTTNVTAVSYKAAVVDYRSRYDKQFTPTENILKNIKFYDIYADDAKNNGAEIIVFPEYGLTTMDNIPEERKDFLPFSTPIPDVAHNPCEKNENISKVVENLSCIAKKYKMYLVVNIAERVTEENGNFKFHNTDVVFNRTGEIIAKYRKTHLYSEPALDSNDDKNKAVTFETDFGVTFGLITCFDILFYEPAKQMVEAGITDFIFPTAWMSELPFLNAMQVQSGWARSHGVNLLASNIQYPEKRSGGSGIYSAMTGIVKFKIPKIGDETAVIIGDVPKIEHAVINKTYEGNSVLAMEEPFYIPTVSNMMEFKFENIKTSNFRSELTYENLKCEFVVDIKYQMENETDYFYKIVAYEGPTSWGDTDGTIQVCSIVSCLNNSISSCGLISKEKSKLSPFNTVYIKATTGAHKKFFMLPTATTYDLKPLPYHYYTFDQTNGIYHMELQRPVQNLITFGLYLHVDERSAGSIATPAVLIPIIISTIFYL